MIWEPIVNCHPVKWPNKAHSLDGGKPRRLQLEHHWPATSDAQR
jgi:hypothetical protein